MRLNPEKVDPRDYAIVLMTVAAVNLPLNNAALVIGMGGVGAGLAHVLNRVLVEGDRDTDDDKERGSFND